MFFEKVQLLRSSVPASQNLGFVYGNLSLAPFPLVHSPSSLSFFELHSCPSQPTRALFVQKITNMHEAQTHTCTHTFSRKSNCLVMGVDRLVQHLVIRGVRYSTTGLEKSKDKPICTPDRTHNRIRSPRLAVSGPEDKLCDGSWQARSVTSGKFGSEDCVSGSLC